MTSRRRARSGILARQTFEVIAFDGDDTLWHNERSYRSGRERFRQMLARAGVTEGVEAIERRVTQTEVDNIQYYGYGVSSFVLSLLETAIDLSDGRITGGDLRHLIDIARDMVTEQVEVYAAARDVLAALSASYPLMLVTKGDLLHQRSKLDRSGLDRYFRYVEIVSHKTPPVYRSILERHRIEPSRFLMVGNSLRSDVLPVVAAGGWAVHVPAELTWSHEHAVATRQERARFIELDSLGDLLDVVGGLGHGRPRAAVRRPRTTPTRRRGRQRR